LKENGIRTVIEVIFFLFRNQIMVSLPPIGKKFQKGYDIIFRNEDQAVHVSRLFEENKNKEWVIHEGGPTVTRVKPNEIRLETTIRHVIDINNLSVGNWPKRWQRITYNNGLREMYQTNLNFDDKYDNSNVDAVKLTVDRYAPRDDHFWYITVIIESKWGRGHTLPDMSLIVPEFWDVWGSCPIANIVDFSDFKLYSMSFFSRLTLSELYKSTIMLDMDLTSFMNFPKYNNVNNNDSPRKYNIGPGILRNERKKYFPLQQNPRETSSENITDLPFRRQRARSIRDSRIGNNKDWTNYWAGQWY
jgi:hypothetical protein